VKLYDLGKYKPCNFAIKQKNMLIDLNEDTLADLVNQNNIVVQFSASWCGNCRIMKPKLKN
jgi:thiol-disulfide isomerase/thioredoxin